MFRSLRSVRLTHLNNVDVSDSNSIGGQREAVFAGKRTSLFLEEEPQVAGARVLQASQKSNQRPHKRVHLLGLAEGETQVSWGQSAGGASAGRRHLHSREILLQ